MLGFAHQLTNISLAHDICSSADGAVGLKWLCVFTVPIWPLSLLDNMNYNRRRLAIHIWPKVAQ